jgi:hypothetical protein
MGRSRWSQADVPATALVAVLACAAAAAGAPAAVTIVLGLALFAAPGYLLGRLLVGSRASGLELAAVMAGLALAVPVLGGLLLYAAGVPLHRPGWLGLLAGVTLASDAALLLRRRGARAVPPGARAVPPGGRAAPPGGRAGPSGGARRAGPPGGRARRVPRWQAAAFAAAVLVAAGGVALARIGVAAQPQAGFTQLWLSPRPGGGHTLSLGVTNDQGSTTSYRLVLQRDGRTISAWNLTLGDGRTWQRQVPGPSGGHALAAALYRLPDLAHAYRYVSTGGRT